MIWTPYPAVPGDYMLVVISRRSGLVDHFESYDVNNFGKNCDGRSGKTLAHDLNRISANHIVVLFTNGPLAV